MFKCSHFTGTQQERSRVFVTKLQDKPGALSTLSGFGQCLCFISLEGTPDHLRNRKGMEAHTNQRGGELRNSTLEIFDNQRSGFKIGKRHIRLVCMLPYPSSSRGVFSFGIEGSVWLAQNLPKLRN